ncbi:MAG: TolC family protein [Myxococcales bacterium]|nr:TolC family protein [Myxococcales bacterium]
MQVSSLCLGLVALLSYADPEQLAVNRPEHRIRLAEALVQAIENNPELQQVSIDLAVAEAQVLSASGVDDIILGLDISYDQQQPPSESTRLVPKSTEATAILSFSKSFATGTLVDLSFGAIYTESNFNVSGGELDLYTGRAQVSLTQPLLRGRGRKAARNSLTQAVKTKNVVSIQQHGEISSVVRQVIETYWNLSYATREQEIRTRSLQQATDRLSLTSKKIATGIVPEAEGLAVKQVIASRQAALLVSEQLVYAQVLELKCLSGVVAHENGLSLRPSEPLKAVAQEIHPDEVVTLALANNWTIAAFQAEVERAQLQMAFTQTQRRPQLDLQVLLSANGVSEELTSSIYQVSRISGYTATARLTYRQSLANRGARGDYQVAQKNLQRILLDVARTRTAVAAEALRATQRVKTAGARMALENRAIELSKRNIDAEQVRFDLGKSTNFDVLMRQDEWRDAQLRYARAVADYLIATAIIEDLTGQLLVAYGITAKTPW